MQNTINYNYLSKTSNNVNQINLKSKTDSKNHSISTDASDLNNKEKLSKGAKVGIGSGLACLAATGIYLAFGRKTNQIKSLIQLSKKDIEELKKIDKHPFETKGNSIQESIEKFFGKDSNIKPHTYDLSKEYPAITVYRDCGGYKDLIITPDGYIDYKDSINLPKFLTHSICYGTKQNRLMISEKILDERAISTFACKDPLDFSNRGTILRFNVLSPSNKLTPVQQDLEKIISDDKLFNEFSEKIDKACQFRVRTNENWEFIKGKGFFKDGQKAETMFEPADYDTILSIIQTIAQKAL